VSRLKTFQEKLKQRTKFQMFKSLFQALTTTVVAVVVVVTIIPNSPKASFDEIKAFSDEIIYQVSVSDLDNAVEESSIKVILENQITKEVDFIGVGQSMGSFSDLTPNTKYDLKVVYDKGFGEETLAKTEVYTETFINAAFSGYNQLETGEISYLNYRVNVKYADNFNYDFLRVRYGLKYPSSDVVESFQTIDLSPFQSEFLIEDVLSYKATLVLILEAEDNGEFIPLDQISIVLPYTIYSSMYLAYYNDHQVAFHIYYDYEMLDEVNYWIETSLNDYVVDKRAIFFNETDHHSSLEIIDKLMPEKEYMFRLIVEYQDPYTLQTVERVVSEVSLTTLSEFDYEIEFIEYQDYYEVSISTNSEVFNQAFYDIYVTELDSTYYYGGSNFTIELNETFYYVSFRVDKLLFEDYYIEIGIRSSTEYYHRIKIEKIEGN
jgi:hypothetical protein